MVAGIGGCRPSVAQSTQRFDGGGIGGLLLGGSKYGSGAGQRKRSTWHR
jgi:hypothetical protein